MMNARHARRFATIKAALNSGDPQVIERASDAARWEADHPDATLVERLEATFHWKPVDVVRRTSEIYETLKGLTCQQ